QLLQQLMLDDRLSALISAGARLHHTGCNGCIGMGQAPASDKNSLRTTPRNFPGRSGTREDKVWLCSPETAAASALTGKITDPRTLPMNYPVITAPKRITPDTKLFVAPIEDNSSVTLVKGPNINALPTFEPLPTRLELPVLLKVGDDLSTDEIMPAGARVLPYRSNIPKIAEFAFEMVSDDYVKEAKQLKGSGGHAIIGGTNYGQG